MSFQITIIDHDLDGETAVFSAIVPSIDLPALSALIFQPVAVPKKPRSDKGVPRKVVENGPQRV